MTSPPDDVFPRTLSGLPVNRNPERVAEIHAEIEARRGAPRDVGDKFHNTLSPRDYRSGFGDRSLDRYFK